MEALEVRILPYVWYNQIQAHLFGLNQNQAIIMNYLSLVLPSWAESRNINGKTYFWWTLSKGLEDMPTLDIKETTMRTNINHLIKIGVLEKEIVSVNNKQRAYYRVTRKWLEEGSFAYPSDFNTLLTLLQGKFKDGTFTPENMNALSKFVEWEKKEIKPVVFSLEWIKWDEFATHIINELKRWEKWLNIKEEINWEFIVDIINHIKSIWENRAWYKMWFDGKPEEQTIKKMKDRFSSMMDWALEKRKIKNLKLTINTWYKKDYI